MDIGVTERQVGVMTKEALQRLGQQLAEDVKAGLLAATRGGMQPHEALLALVAATSKASWDAGFTKDFFFQFAGAIFDQMKRQVEAGKTQICNGWLVDHDGRKVL